MSMEAVQGCASNAVHAPPDGTASSRGWHGPSSSLLKTPAILGADGAGVRARPMTMQESVQAILGPTLPADHHTPALESSSILGRQRQQSNPPASRWDGSPPELAPTAFSISSKHAEEHAFEVPTAKMAYPKEEEF